MTIKWASGAAALTRRTSSGMFSASLSVGTTMTVGPVVSSASPRVTELLPCGEVGMAGTRSALIRDQAAEVSGVVCRPHEFGAAQNVFGRDIAEFEGNLLKTGHLEPLSFLYGLDE